MARTLAARVPAHGAGALEALARTGFIVKGVLYVVVGVLALRVAAHDGGRVTGTRGALRAVLEQPFGHALLLAAAVGLFGYAAWRILQGVADPDGYGTGWTGLGMRIGFIGRGIMHAAIGRQAWLFYEGVQVHASGTERAMAAQAMAWPFGAWVLVIIGVVMIAFAISQVHDAWSGHLEDNLDLAELRREAGAWAVTLSRFGIASRAVLLALLGWGAAMAGWSHDAGAMPTTVSPMRLLAAQPGDLGRFLLAVAAAGSIAYGVYQFLHARYLRIRLAR